MATTYPSKAAVHPSKAAGCSSKTVLITGCSSGIGRATADVLARAGHTVYATARREASCADLVEWAEGFPGHAHSCQLDVTDGSSIDRAVRRILDAEGGIDVLVNNAGYGQMGAVEDVGPQLWRDQMETNLVGVVAVTQAVLPAMRRRRAGRIINISSVVAHVTLPLMGPYSASKHALNAMSKALRIEAGTLGIEVVLIEPGPITTDFRANAERGFALNRIDEQSPYAPWYQLMARRWAGMFGRAGRSADDVARLIRRAVEARRPRTCYRITAPAVFVPRLVSFVPDRLLDGIFKRAFGFRSSGPDA